jgi:predicted DNA binding CopG/RHH family protein
MEMKQKSMQGTKKKLPKFNSEDEERKFWARADSTKYLDWSSSKRKKLVNLKPSVRTISLRLPVSMLEDLKIQANRRDVPYQSLLKVYLAERLAQERREDPHARDRGSAQLK